MPSSKANTIRHHLLVLFAYTVLTLVMTYPTGLNLLGEIPASGGDAWQTLWRFQDRSSALMAAWNAGNAAEFIGEEFLGFGPGRLVNVSVWPWMPLYWLFGLPLAYNLIWLISFVMAGYGVFLLVGALTEKAEIEGKNFILSGAFLAGVMYMFLPFHVAHARGHFGAMQIQWMPLIFAMAVIHFRRPTKPSLALLSLLIIAQSWSEHHYLLWLAVTSATGLAFFYRPLTNLWRVYPHKILLICCAILTAVVSFAPYLPTLRVAARPDNPLDLGRDQLIRFSADLFSFVVPAPWHTIWGGATEYVFNYKFTGNDIEAVQFLGYLPLLLIVFYHQKISRKTLGFWLALGGIFFLIALGPQLHLFGRVTNIHLPYELVDSLPVISSVRAVGRAGIMIGLGAAVLFGLVVSTQVHRKQIAALIGGILLVELLFLPVNMQAVSISGAYELIRNMPGRTLLEIPASTNYVLASRAVYAGSVHGKELAGNIALERADTSSIELIKKLPVVRQLMYLRTTDLREERLEFFGQRFDETLPDVLHYLDAAAIVIHTDSLTELQTSSLRAFLEKEMGLAGRQVDDVVFYPLKAGFEKNTDGIFLMRDASWAGVGYDENRNSYFAEVDGQASITIVNTRDTAATVRLSFIVPAQSTGEGDIMYNGKSLLRIPSGEQSIGVEIDISPGQNEVLFTAATDNKLILQNPLLETLN